jgi:hypothetical protein
MLVVFYLIVVPSVLAFFLGYIAHGLKTMTKTSAIESGDSSEHPLSEASGELKQLEAGKEETLPA